MATFGPVAPIQYQVPQPNPLGGLGQGFQLGAMMEQAQAARESRALQRQQIALAMQQRQQKMEAERQAAEQRKAAQAALARSFTKPITQWTGDDLAALTAGLDKEQLTVFQKFTETRSAAQKANDARFYGQVISAIKSNEPGVAARLLTERSEGESDPNEKKVFSSLAQSVLEAPDATAKQLTLMNANLGPEYLNAMKAVFPEPTEAFKVLTPAEAKARGLPTDRGQIWQLNTKTNQTTALQAGEKPTELPSDIRILDAVGLPRTPENLMALKGAGATKVTVGGEAKPTRFQDKVDEKAANVYTEWTLEGGSSNAAARIAQLTDVTKTLDKFPELTGPAIGAVPEWAQALIIPRTKALRQNAERIIQEGLRPILGAQFTQAEGENFLKRAFDPSLGAAENARRLKLITQQMKVAAEQKNKFTKYIEQNGTLIGFKGKIPTIADFDAALGIQPAAEQQPAAEPVAAKPAPTAQATAVSSPTVTTRPLPPQGAIDFLRRNPEYKAAFDAKYGPGLSDRILGGQ